MARLQLTAEQTEQTRSEFLDVAQDLYERHGLDGMSFRAIASVSGCSATKPYLYFGSKADLVDGLRIRAYEWLRDELNDAVARVDDPNGALRALAVAYVHAGVERPRMYELLYSQDGAMEETDPALLEAKQEAIGVCRRAIVDAAAATSTELVADADTVAHIFWVAAHGLVSLERGGFLVVGRAIDELLPTLFDVVVQGTTKDKN